MRHSVDDSPKIISTERRLRLGFVPLTDCAPLVMAQELGLFRKYGLRVELSREVGWATVRDKILYGELDTAHALAPMPFAATLGLGSVHCDCVAALVLSLNGNAITLSEQLWRDGVRDAATLRAEITRLRNSKTFTFGVVFPHSSHNFLLQHWLASAGIHPERDVRIVVLPPASMYANLKCGNLDGYCVGEPWNSLAIHDGAGWAVTTTAQLAPRHPEKVLMTRRAFAGSRHEEHIALIAALIEACAWCDVPENRSDLADLLAHPRYLNSPADRLRTSLCGPFDLGHGRTAMLPEFTVFHRDDANLPSRPRAAWIINHLLRLVPDENRSLQTATARVFRADLYEEALKLTSPSPASDPASPEPVTLSIP